MEERGGRCEGKMWKGLHVRGAGKRDVWDGEDGEV